jgi:hypothetical protein
MIDLTKYSNSLISRLFTAIDLTKQAETEEEKQSVTKFIDNLSIEVEGSLKYYTDVSSKVGNDMAIVLMKLRGIRTISDYNVRRSVLFTCIGKIDNINKNVGQ